jgi:IS30 family transposase
MNLSAASRWVNGAPVGVDARPRFSAELRIMGRPRALTPQQEDEIRALRAAGKTYRELAERFGVSLSTICLTCRPASREHARDAARRWAAANMERVRCHWRTANLARRARLAK